MTGKLPPKVLVIESDKTLSISTCNAIERYWFNTVRATNENEALNRLNTNALHVILISSRLKDISAVEMAFRIKKMPQCQNIPIIFLLDIGENTVNYSMPNANLVEFLFRPFGSDILILAIKSILRRSKPVLENKIISYKDVHLNLSTYTVKRQDKAIHLGATEFKILKLFMKSPDTIFSRTNIISHVWPPEKKIEKRTVDVHINRLRMLMKINKGEEPLIKTVRASGYCLNYNDDDAIGSE
ncbi:MAG: winged helix-turn-helix domain-containing protein [Rickettsiaceae bacterium]